jgi:hypothetical protein
VRELRKTGFRVVCGIQNYEQVEDLYGRNGAVTITTNLSNKVILRATDANSAERQSKVIGDARFQVTKLGASAGSDGKTSTNTNVNEEVSRLVLASEISSLPDLTAFVKFAGEETAFYTSIPIYGVDQKLIETEDKPKALPAPSGLSHGHLESVPAPTAREQVDKMLKQIGGDDWDSERLKDETLKKLEWMKGHTQEKFTLAQAKARQVLADRLDKSDTKKEKDE